MRRMISMNEPLRRVLASFVLCASVLASAFTSPAAFAAESVADFYRGKQIHIVVGFGPGAAYDTFARLYARFLGKYIPGNPSFVVENKPGAASLIASNYLYSVAPRDGSVIATISRDMPLLSKLDPSNVRFDPQNFTWIGSPSNYANDAFLLWLRDDAKNQSLNSATPITIAATAKGSSSNDIAHLISKTVKINLKIIDGYQDDAAMTLAVDKKEVDGAMVGITATSAIRPAWMKPGGGLHPILQFARADRHPLFPDVPTARELAKDDRALALIRLSEMPFALGFPLVGPPGIPADRVAALRTAYAALSKDPEYLDAIKKLGFMYSPVGGEDLLATVKRIEMAPAEMVSDLRDIREIK